MSYHRAAALALGMTDTPVAAPAARGRPLIVTFASDPSILEALQPLSLQLGFDVEASSCSLALVNTIACRTAILAVVDFDRADLDGLELLSRIRATAPDCEVVAFGSDDSGRSAVQVIARGARDYLTKPVDADRLRRVLNQLRDEAAGRAHIFELEAHIAEQAEFCGMVGRSAAMQNVFRLIKRLAPHARSLLITGEPGTGKSAIARAFHESSPRRDGPLVVLHGPSDQRVDEMLAAAAGGTLVVDDVSEMPRRMQIHLAEALEARGQGSAHGDFAVVALTAHDLRARVADERFSGELFDRLCRLELTIPPLRERRDDIPYLTAAFVRRVAARLGKPVDAVTPAAERVLSTARWEGNVRELSQVVERACILANSRLITERELSGPAASAALNDTKPTEIFSQGLPLARRDTAPLGYIEREHIVDTLRRVGGNRMAAAKVLGISRRALYRRLERHHILLPSSQGGRQRHLS